MSAQGQISRRFMFMMAMTCALCAGCNYFNQPLIYSIAEDLQISVAQSGWTVVLTQIGYATGLFLFVPLGDLFEKRLYICSLMLCTGLALIGLSASTNLHMLYGFTLLASFCSITTQILIPFAASLSHDRADGDDLCQAALEKGLRARDQWQPGRSRWPAHEWCSGWYSVCPYRGRTDFYFMVLACGIPI